VDDAPNHVGDINQADRDQDNAAAFENRSMHRFGSKFIDQTDGDSTG
jgi:hypothetical protein